MDDFFLPKTRIAVVGLGLMGGSLAMALRGHCGALFGIDPDPETREQARQLDLVDQVASQPTDLLPDADLVILAAPVRVIIALIDQLPDLHPGNAVVMDIGSTKAQIMAAMGALPDRFDPVGGHPMAGKERGSITNADAALYAGATFALTPLERTSSRARTLALEIVNAVGAAPLWMDAETHDRWVCATSHLPYLISNALAAVTPIEAAPLVGPGFRSTARLAPSTPEMMLDILTTNRTNLLEAVTLYRQRLDELDAALNTNDTELLKRLLMDGGEKYDRVIRKDVESHAD